MFLHDRNQYIEALHEKSRDNFHALARTAKKNDYRNLRTRARGVGTEKNSHPAPTGLIAILFLSFFDTKSVPVQQRELTIKSIFRSKKHEIPVPPAVEPGRPEAEKSQLPILYFANYRF